MNRRSFIGFLAGALAAAALKAPAADNFAEALARDPAVPVTRPRLVTVPAFEIYSNPMISIADIKERRFDVYSRYSRFGKAA